MVSRAIVKGRGRAGSQCARTYHFGVEALNLGILLVRASIIAKVAHVRDWKRRLGPFESKRIRIPGTMK